MTWEAIFRGDFDPDDVRAYGKMLRQLHEMQDALASMSLERELIDQLAADLSLWAERLHPFVTDEAHQINGRAPSLAVRGHAMLPELHIMSRDEGRVEGTVQFGRWFMGGGMAAHGGAVALLFDEVLGILAAVTAGAITRTAYLHTDFRALTPIDHELNVAAWIDRVEGRKLFVRGEIRHGDVVCAEGEGLFIELTPEQGFGKSTTG